MAQDLTAVTGRRHALVTISNMPLNDLSAWATLSGGGQTAPVMRAYNGGSSKSNIIAGRVIIADVTTTRPWEPYRDGPLLAALRKVVTKLVVKSITLQFLGADGVRIGKAQTFTGCLLTGVQGFDYDESSGDAAHITAVWTPSNVV